MLAGVNMNLFFNLCAVFLGPVSLQKKLSLVISRILLLESNVLF